MHSSLIGKNYLIPTLRLSRNNKEHVSKVLNGLKHVRHSPPIVLDVADVSSDGTPYNMSIKPREFQSYLQQIRELGFFPVGISNGSADVKAMALRYRIPSVMDAMSEEVPIIVATEDNECHAEINQVQEKVEQPSAMVVESSLRTGQQVYAKGRSLVVMGSVSSGAEVLADGDITVLGQLRGRAFAGVKGNKHARIYAQTFDAELVAIASVFTVCDELQQDFGNTTYAYLDRDKLHFQGMGNTAEGVLSSTVH